MRRQDDGRTWDEVTAGSNAKGVRYGLMRDTGDDGAPVPQYVSRETPADPAQVGQRSVVG